MNKTFVGIIIVAVLLITSGLYYFFKDDPIIIPSPTASENPDKVGTVQFLGTSLNEVKNGQVQWEVKADQISAVDKKLINLSNVKAQIFGSGDQGKIQIIAKEGQYDTVSKIITLQGSIKAVSDKGNELLSNMTQWFTGEHRFVAEGDVRYRGQDVVISGDKMETEQNLTHIRVTGNARAELRRASNE
jgi:LPS export ABC transporter protein LptC